MQWTDERKTYLFTARRRGKTTAQIAVTMSDWFLEEITEAELDALWQSMIDSGWVKKKRHQLDAFRKKHVFAGEDPAAEKRRLVNANILHLVDLKRAGHSPTRTEYKIAPEGHGVRYRTTDTCSYIGSSAASCAAEV
jgi:hypothetical protein